MRVGAGRHPDRLLAFGAVVIAAAVFAVVLASSGESELANPPPPPPDPTAATQMLALMRAGEGMKSVVTYDFTRRALGGAEQPSVLLEAQLNGTQAIRIRDALDITTATSTYHCQLAGGKPDCTEKRAGRVLPPSEVFEAAIGTGKYVVTRAADATIAGEQARCFETKSINGQPYLADIGSETLLCFASDGVVLRKQVAEPNPVNDLAATEVQRRVDDAALAPLLAGFDKGTPALGG